MTEVFNLKTGKGRLRNFVRNQKDSIDPNKKIELANANLAPGHTIKKVGDRTVVTWSLPLVDCNPNQDPRAIEVGRNFTPVIKTG